MIDGVQDGIWRGMRDGEELLPSVLASSCSYGVPKWCSFSSLACYEVSLADGIARRRSLAQ